MAYFDSKYRTVFSPQNEKLLPLYETLEKHHSTIGGSRLFDELTDTLEYLDQILEEVDNEATKNSN